MGQKLNIVEKMFPGMDAEVEKIAENRYHVKITSKAITIDGEVTFSNNEVKYDIKKITNGDSTYTVTKQFYRRPNTDSITRINDVIIVTNLSVETATRKTKHSTNYMINLEYLFSIPIKSLTTPSRSIYSDISFYKVTKYPAYITLETKTEKYSSNIIEDVEKAIFIYSIYPEKIRAEYHDVIKPVEIENNLSATIKGGGVLQKIIERMKKLIYQ